jgi:hypothetical protein
MTPAATYPIPGRFRSSHAPLPLPLPLATPLVPRPTDPKGINVNTSLPCADRQWETTYLPSRHALQCNRNDSISIISRYEYYIAHAPPNLLPATPPAPPTSAPRAPRPASRARACSSLTASRRVSGTRRYLIYISSIHIYAGETKYDSNQLKINRKIAIGKTWG